MKKFIIRTDLINDLVIQKIKKYLLFISTLLFFILGAHLVYLYLYDGASSEPEVGGTVSEAIIGSFPHFNPLVPSNDHNAYINGLLYRSLLQYSPKTGKLESDLASCDLENLAYIECTLESNLEWSNGESITLEDIKATLGIIQETKVHPIIASLLEKTKITVTENSIIFQNSSKDINFVQVLLQSIIPKTLVDTLTSETVGGKFSETGGIYSGRFVLTSISQDETVGITKITLGKNEKYFGSHLYIQFLILNLFRDEEHFLKNKNSFNLFNDKDAIVGNSIPRLENFEYTLSQFVGSFFNSESIPRELRVHLASLFDRDDIVNTLGEQKVLSAINPFLSDVAFDMPSENFSLEAFMEKQKYYSKKELLKSFIAGEAQKQEALISQESTPVPEKQEAAKKQQSLSYITSPSTQKYNFVSDDNILLQGKVDTGVDAVYINDYKLSGYNAGDDVFYYRLLESYDSITPGVNTYTLFFETQGKKKAVEEFVYIYESDSEKLASLEKDFFSTTETPSGSQTSEKVSDTSRTPAPKIATSLSQDTIQALDERLYYTADGKPYSLKLVYAQSDANMEITAGILKETLSQAGILAEVVPASLGDISIGLRDESLKYDILLIGVNLGYFGSNLFPYFHSSQVKNGYNFSNYKKLSLDILLEELSSNILSVSKEQELQAKMLEILKEEATLKVFYTPKVQLLVDKNIKNFTLPSYLPDGKHRFYPLLDAYLSEKRSIKTEEKGGLGFIYFLLKTLFIK